MEVAACRTPGARVLSLQSVPVNCALRKTSSTWDLGSLCPPHPPGWFLGLCVARKRAQPQPWTLLSSLFLQFSAVSPWTQIIFTGTQSLIHKGFRHTQRQPHVCAAPPVTHTVTRFIMKVTSQRVDVRRSSSSKVIRSQRYIDRQ